MTGDLRCAFGETGDGWAGPHHCHLCAQKVDEAVTFMAVAFALGTHDAEGYTPNERKAQRKRKMVGGVDPDTGASRRSAPVPNPTNPIVKPGDPHPDQGLPGQPAGPGNRPDQGLPGRPGSRPDRPEVEPPVEPTEPEPKK